MKFESRSLRVQLPCKSVTVIEAAELDVRLEAHKYWRAVAIEHGVKFQVPEGTCEECSGNPSEPLCTNLSEDLNPYAWIDHRVLPILRKQLEARLAQLADLEKAVAQAGGK